MEIISYVGAADSYGMHHSRRNFHVPARAVQLNVKSYGDSVISAVRRTRAQLSLSFLLSIICIGVCVPAAVWRVSTYFLNHMNPVHMASLPSSELEILNNAMSQFALERSDDSVDENGNVLADDGTILTAATVGVGRHVTYTSYTVKSGDTISSVTRKAGLTNISTLIAVNDISNVRTLRAGQKIQIPSQDGIVHTVVSGESLNLLATRYHVSVEKLLDANDLDSRTLLIGQKVFVPGAKMDSSSLRKVMGELFMYPLASGCWRLTSPFGPRPDPFTGVKTFHTGIDMAAVAGTPIKAAMSGKVVYVGFSNVFGNYVIINHGNGYQTLYGHMKKTLARVGQSVSQGTQIGLVGSTGYSTGPHLHFTVYKNGKLVDPLTLLK